MEQMGNRTIYLGGVNEDITIRDICDHVRGGLIDHVKVLAEKKCAFVCFVEARSAMYFYQRTSRSGELVVKGKPLKVGWGKSRNLHSDIAAAISQQGATRNVFLGNIDDTVTESKLMADLSKHGHIEKINVLPSKNIAFINFSSIQAAINVVKELKSEGSELCNMGYSKFRANYGKDRCASDAAVPRTYNQPYGQGGSQQHQQQSTNPYASQQPPPGGPPAQDAYMGTGAEPYQGGGQYY